MKLAFATGNIGKLREASEILGSEYELVTPAQLGIDEDIPETGATLKENSLQKAEYLHNRSSMDCFADDSGLEVDALGGAPGVYSARYGGKAHDSQANMSRLLKELDGISSRKARFRTVVSFIHDGQTLFFEGVLEGRIAQSQRGTGGFGYDPLFIPDVIPSEDGALVPNVEGHTLAEFPDGVKNAISHRGKALRALAEYLHGK